MSKTKQRLWTKFGGKEFFARMAENATNDGEGNEIAQTYATNDDLATKQNTLTFGYNSNNQIVSIDSHDLAPSTDSTVYLAHYTVTTGANIKAALAANKAVMSKSGNTVGLLGSYNLTNNQYQFTIIKKTTNVYEQDAGDINYSGVFCSGKAWFGQTGSLTFKAPTSAGQVMKSVKLSNGKYDWALSTINGIPSSTAADENKVLSVNSQGSPEWTALENDVFGTPLLNENDQPILDEETGAPIYDASSTDQLWTGFAGKEFGARRAYADQNGDNIVATYATKSSVDTLTADLETALDTLNDTIETVSHAGMYDLGTKDESDLNNGKLAIGCGNSNTELTLTTVSALTVLANSGVPNFALLVDNSGNSNDVTVTVKDSTDATTFYQSTAAGNKVSAGKICQITCVGRCWTLAEFGTANA